MAIFGRNEIAEYFSKLAYVDKPEHEFLGKRVFNDITEFSEEANEDIVFAEANWPISSFLLKKGFLILPQINFTLDISETLEMIQKRMNPSKIRRIKGLLGAGYSFETTKDPKVLQSFYYEMYCHTC